MAINSDHADLEYSAITSVGLPIKRVEKWYRNCDSYGHQYFLTREDSKLLYEANEIYIDGTFRPVSGVKRMFPQLYIFSIRKELPN